MKLAFSTLGCPDWSFEDMFSLTSDLGYDGIEIRGIADEIYAPKIKAFQPGNLEHTKKILKEHHLSIPILTSGAYLSGNPDISAAEFETKDYIMLAAELGVAYVRVLGERGPEPEGSFDFEETLRRYRALCSFAAEYGVSLLIETNGALADSAVMKRFMEGADAENAGVIWDIHHTVRFFGESPELTVSNLGNAIKHTHIKDSVRGRNGAITYMLSGYGDIPIKESVAALKKIGYSGYYSYEWVKRWSRELAEPGIAFYQYVTYMKSLEG